jgi:hypothetical protein
MTTTERTSAIGAVVPIDGYDGRYAVTKSGDVLSRLSGRLLKPGRNKKGYLTVGLFKEGCPQRSEYVHRLVAVAFHGAKPGLHVNHKDGDKTNNRPENLEWVTIKENNHHAILSGLKRVSPQCFARLAASDGVNKNQPNREG